MNKTVVITQSNYIPWRGYFDLIRKADELILLDSVQYTRRDWRNRNVIKTATGTSWLTIPVEVKGQYHQSIDQTRIADTKWAEHHIRTIELSYRKASGFEETAPWLFDIMRQSAKREYLSQSNSDLLIAISRRLGITTPIRRCTDIIDRELLLSFKASQRLAKLCEAVGATEYLSGPAAQSYLDTEAFAQKNIKIAWMQYDGYRDYSQCWGTFEGRVSIVDLLLNCGAHAPAYMVR